MDVRNGKSSQHMSVVVTVCGNVCCVAAIVFCLGVLKYVCME